MPKSEKKKHDQNQNKIQAGRKKKLRRSVFLPPEKNIGGGKYSSAFREAEKMCCRVHAEIAGARARAHGAEPNVSRKALCARTIGVLGASGAAPEDAKIVRKRRDLQSRANQSPRKRADGTRL